MGNKISKKSKEIKNRCTNLSLCKQCNEIQPCIGDKGCSIETIVKILSKSVTFGNFTDNWIDLAVALEINSFPISKWQKGLNLDTINIKMVLSKILEEWVANSKTREGEPKVSVLIENLESEGFKEMAHELRQNLVSKYPSLNNTKPNGETSYVAGYIPHICTSLSGGHISIAINNNSKVELESLVDQTKSSESNNATQSTKDNSENKNETKLRYWIVLCILLIAIIVSLAVYFGIRHNSETKTPTIPTSSCLEHAWFGNDMYQIDASSFNAYQNLAEKVSGNQPISLAIKVNGTIQWPRDGLLINACYIKELNVSGFVDFSFLSWILNQATQVESFHLDIKNWSDCEDQDTIETLSNVDQYYASVLPNLSTLTFSHSCGNTMIYNFFSLLQMENLETFKINNGIINELNIEYLRTIQKQSSKLTTFHLIAQLRTDQLFYPTNYTTSIKEIKIENITETSQKFEYSRLILGEDFCDTFPELKIFQSTSSCIAFNDRYLVFSCPNLNKLTTSICYTGNEYYRLGIVQKLSHLEEIDFYLVFPNCPPADELEGVRQEIYNSTVPSKRVCSNCIIHSTRESYCVT